MKNEVANQPEKCPLCGQNSLEVMNEAVQLALPFTKSESYLEEYVRCKNCGFEQNLSSKNEVNRKNVYLKLKQQSMVNMIESLDSQGLKMAYVERAFDLPARTLYRMKSENEVSSAALALMRTVTTYPWLTYVAERHYDPNIAEQSLIVEGLKSLSRASINLGYRSYVTQAYTELGSGVSVQFIKPEADGENDFLASNSKHMKASLA